MARRGRFGRVGQVAPSLTATIIALAQEMNNREDQDIMDAWQNGGTFEGKPVTDEMMLRHWQDRLSGVSRDDPLYDEYKNNVTQLQYRIDYSKHYTRYLEGGRKDNAGMQQLFLDWAKKAPPNSEFARQLRQDAAGYANLAAADARAAASRAQTEAYYRRQRAIERQYIAPAEYLNAIVDNYAMAKGYIGVGDTTQTLTGGGVNELYNMLASAGDSTVLYTDAAGKKVTVGSVRERIGRYAPDLRFGITAEDLNRINLRAAKGDQIAMGLARRTGHSEDFGRYQKYRAGHLERAREDGIMSTDTKYWTLRQDYENVASNPASSLEEKYDAWNTYQAGLKQLSTTVADDNTRSRLVAEAEGDATKHSIAEDAFGFSGEGGKDIAVTQAGVKFGQEQHALAVSGQGYWTTGSIAPDDSGKLVFTPSVGGVDIGLTTDVALAQNLVAGNAQKLYLPTTWGGASKMVLIQGTPIVLKGIGRGTVDSSSPSTRVGTAFIYTRDGQQHVGYQYTASNGRQYFTDKPPWRGDLVVTVTPDSVEIDGTNLVHSGVQGALLAQSLPGIYGLTVNGDQVNAADVKVNPDGSMTLQKRDAQGRPMGAPVPISDTDFVTTLALNPSQLVLDPARSSQPQPGLDFPTLSQAVLSDSDLRTLQADPAYQAAFEQDLINNATNRSTGEVDQTALAADHLQANVLNRGVGSGQSVTQLVAQGALWNWMSGQIGGEPEPGLDAIVKSVAGQAAAPTTVPVTIPAPTESTPATLGNLGQYMTLAAAQSRLGLLPPTVAAAQAATSNVPDISLRGTLKVPSTGNVVTSVVGPGRALLETPPTPPVSNYLPTPVGIHVQRRPGGRTPLLEGGQ